MAKANRNTGTTDAPDTGGTGDTPTESVPHGAAAFALLSTLSTVDYDDFRLDLTTVPPITVAYLAQYGFRKTLQDVVSGMAKVMGDAKVTAADHKAGKYTDKAIGAPVAFTESEIESAIVAKQQGRVDALVAGEMVPSTGIAGTRLTGLAKVTRDVIDEYLAKIAAKQGKKLPTKAEELAPIREKVYGPNKAAIDAEAERRFALEAGTVDIDLGL